MLTNFYLFSRNTSLAILLLSPLMFSDVYAATGGIPGPNPGVGPPPGIINKKTCRDAMITTVMQANMDFGSFAVSAAGTITLTPTGVRIPTVGMDIITTPVTVFTVSINNPLVGCEAFDIKLTLPTTATLTGPGGATMTLSNFVASPVTTATTIAGPISYPYTLSIGADLTGTFPQTAGTYSTPAAAYTLTLKY